MAALWAWEWRFDVSLVLLASGLVYTLGWTRLRWRGHWRLTLWSRWLACLVGLGVIGIALMSPIDTLQNLLFAVHMLQHMLLIYIAAPLLLVGRPLSFSLWGLPASPRRGLGRLLAWRGLLRRGLSVLTQPVVALALSTGILWLWHIPAAYDAALEDDFVHDLEHLSFFGAFLLYWWPLIGSPPQSARLTTNGARALYLIVSAVQSAILGGLIAFWPQVLYTHYLSVPRLGGLSALADQQLSGAIMWFPAPLIYGLAAMLTLRDE